MKTRAITEGAMTCALSVILALAAYYLPLMLILFVFIPVPMVLLTQRRGFAPAVVAGIAATLLLLLMMDWFSAVSYGVYILTMGCGLGFATAKKYPGEVRVAVGFFAGIITLAAAVLLTQAATGVAFSEELANLFNMYSDELTRLSQSMAAGGDVTATVDQLVRSMKMALPVAALLLPAFLSWINVLISDKVLLRMRADIVPMKPLREWEMPRSLRVLLILILFATIILQFTGSEAIPEIYTYTLYELMDVIFVIMGWSLLFWAIYRKKQQEVPLAKAAIIIATFILPLAATLLSWIGTAEAFLNVKKIIRIKDSMKNE